MFYSMGHAWRLVEDAERASARRRKALGLPSLESEWCSGGEGRAQRLGVCFCVFSVFRFCLNHILGSRRLSIDGGGTDAGSQIYSDAMHLPRSVGLGGKRD